MNASDRMLVGQFIERDSAVHRLDPRIKIIGLLLLMIVIMMMDSRSGYAAATVVVLIILLLSKIPLGFYFRGLLPLLPVLILTLLYHTTLGKGQTLLVSYGFLHITVEGILEGVRIVWRILLMILAASALTGTTRPLVLAQGLETLLKPLSKLRVPVEQFSLMIVIAIRFIPTILEEIQRIRLARRARGFEPSNRNPFSRLTEFIPILVPLLVSTARRADNLTFAIEARAYGDGRGRTIFRPLRLTKPDLAAGCLILLSIAILLVIDLHLSNTRI
ncbi:energy-coupling factor transporter transmembrane component T family protein [Saccharibacillus sacchari]|uniref:energy-coupling factor transporter transmembrane component T family protein n=1 Tax=Saccharibacillus sacchari TaxID=456493 RepID=UPI0004BA8B75|nr:energy-coupling factor transporter transmembrane component T [Saccharibacillus sacchari]